MRTIEEIQTRIDEIHRSTNREDILFEAESLKELIALEELINEKRMFVMLQADLKRSLLLSAQRRSAMDRLEFDLSREKEEIQIQKSKVAELEQLWDLAKRFAAAHYDYGVTSSLEASNQLSLCREELLRAVQGAGLGFDKWIRKSELTAAQKELQIQKDMVETLIEESNKSRRIIYAMSDALQPKPGEHNIDCAQRRMAEIKFLQEKLFSARS